MQVLRPMPLGTARRPIIVPSGSDAEGPGIRPFDGHAPQTCSC